MYKSIQHALVLLQFQEIKIGQESLHFPKVKEKEKMISKFEGIEIWYEIPSRLYVSI
jgi:hypothetical protein